jgi:quinol monooxygenase YgiN
MAKHVTFMKMKAKPGKVDDIRKLMNTEEDQERLKKAGFQYSVMGTSKNDPNTVWGAVTWDTSERYYKNAESPAQNADYEKMRSMLTEDPEWFDCDVVDEIGA